MKQIALPCGKVAFVSDEDWHRVSKLSWSDRGDGYVRARWGKRIGGHGGIVYLHRFLLAAPTGYVVDHIDSNPLNNTRENLQITTQSRNCMRADKAKNGGVTYDRYCGHWVARMRYDGRKVHLGSFPTQEAAQAQLDAARSMVWTDPEFNQLATIL